MTLDNDNYRLDKENKCCSDWKIASKWRLCSIQAHEWNNILLIGKINQIPS